MSSEEQPKKGSQGIQLIAEMPHLHGLAACSLRFDVTGRNFGRQARSPWNCGLRFRAGGLGLKVSGLGTLPNSAASKGAQVWKANWKY